MIPTRLKKWLKSTKIYAFLVERFQWVVLLWLGMWLVALWLPAFYASQTGGDANSASPLPFKGFLDYKFPLALLVSLVVVAGLISIALLFFKEVEGQRDRLRELLERLSDEFSSACTHFLCGTTLILSLQHGWTAEDGVSALLFFLGAVVFFRRADGALRQPAINGAAGLSADETGAQKD